MKLATVAYSKTPRGMKHERHDCGVRALRIAALLTYQEAHADLKAQGRADRDGTWDGQMDRAALRRGFMRIDLPAGGARIKPTLAQFIRAHRVGSYIIRLNRHFIALRDGTVHDWARREGHGPSARVRHAWGR